ncbi:MAG: GNAT family N-acetyltransferase [Chloroflexota bacterium]|nr:GNAT family N-acetyltransferase [Chloroflexota bacterium]
MSGIPSYPPALEGEGLVLRPWDEELVAQMARWGERGFPYHAFDLGHLRDPEAARAALERARAPRPHRHFVACEGGVAVGRVSVNFEDPAGLYLWSVHVPPEHEGRGVCRRMLAVLLRWLEAEVPGRSFVLTTNSFAERAHRAYQALGFTVEGERWQYDPDLAAGLWRATPEQREALRGHLRFENGRWEVRVFVMRRLPGAPMALGPRLGAAAP